jgi:hypothetical protein
MATVAQYAALYGKSERTIKRWRSQGLPLDDETRMRQLMATMHSRLGCRKLASRAPITTHVEQIREPRPEPEFDQAIYDLVSVHMTLAPLLYDLQLPDDDIRARFESILIITRPYVEEPEA